MDEHPFRAAWRTRDVDTWVDALSPDVVLRSPVVTGPFRGRAAARELFGVLFATFGELEVTDELRDGSTHAFFWRGELAGRSIEGADLLRYDAEGKVVEISVLIRPLLSTAVFASAIGPRLASRYGCARGVIVRLLTLPITAMLALADVLAPRLIGLR